MANIFALPRESRPDEDVDVSLPAMLEEDRRFQRLIRFSLCWAVRSDCMAKTLDLLHDDDTYLNTCVGMDARDVSIKSVLIDGSL